MQSSAAHRIGVGLLILVTPFLIASPAGCGAVDPELGFTLGACDIINCDTLFFLGLNDDHDDNDDAEEEEHDDAIEGDDG